VAQRGEELEISFTAPRAGVDGARLGVLDIEIFVAAGEGEFLKVARSRRLKAAPGEALSVREPLPAPGTLMRVAARAIAKGHRGRLGDPVRLVVAPVLVPPRELKARLEGDAVVLEWVGTIPAPLEKIEKKDAEQAPGPQSEPPPPTAPQQGPTSSPGQEAPLLPPRPAPPAQGPGYFVYRREAQGRYAGPLQATATQEAAFHDRAVKPGESWCYVVRAVAAAEPLVESAPSDESCLEVVDVLAPAAPAGLTALLAEDGVELRWSPSGEPDLEAYRVYRLVRRGDWEKVAEVKAPETSHLDAEAPAGTLLRYAVRAVDRAGNESPPSAPAEVRRP
jgi:hypothetical protein